MKKLISRYLPPSFVSHLQDEVVLEVGGIGYTRDQMVNTLRCANFMAAVRLTENLKKIGIKNVKGLFKLGPDALYNTRGVGTAQVYVAMCVLDANGFSVEKWWGWVPKKQEKQEVGWDEEPIGAVFRG